MEYVLIRLKQELFARLSTKHKQRAVGANLLQGMYVCDFAVYGTIKVIGLDIPENVKTFVRI